MRLTMALFWLGMAVWISSAIAPAAAAISVFSTLPRMGISVAGTEEFFADAPAEAGPYAAGRSIQPLFGASDWVQMAAAALCVSTSIRWWRLGAFAGPPWMAVVAVVLVLLGAALFAVHLGQAGAMRVPLDQYWQAIAETDRSAAAAAKAQFDQLHRHAERLSSIQLAVLLTAVAATAAVHAHTPRSPAPAA